MISGKNASNVRLRIKSLALVRSWIAIYPTIDVFLNSDTASPLYTGIAARAACGNIIYMNVCNGVNPNATPASVCPRPMLRIAVRNISLTYAPNTRAKLMTATKVGLRPDPESTT